MPLLSKPSFAPPTALIYITLGALLDVWTVVWYFWFARDQQGYISHDTWFWLSGLFFTGLVLMLIGFYLGRIGRAARKAETPPPEVEPAEATIQQTAAGTPHPIVTGAGAAVPGQAVPMSGTTVPGTPMPPPQAAPPAPPPYVPGVTKR
jgi:hypothetical protein